MDKNYYDWLEISKNASPEIIEKAYKTLVKKYHPDLQQENKDFYEKTLQKINEAYEVLSDSQRRQEYDASLISDSVSSKDYEDLFNENKVLKKELSNLKNSSSVAASHVPAPSSNNVSNQSPSVNMIDESDFREKVSDILNQAYHDAYITDLKNRGYKIKYKRSFKDYLRIFITFIVTLLVLFLIYQIPFVNNYFHDLYNENSIVKLLVDTFLNIWNSIINAF